MTLSLFSALEQAFGQYLGRFYSGLVADTPQMKEYVARGLSKSIVYAPGRMVDKVEDVLNEWRKNQNVSGPGLSSLLPVCIVCIDEDFTPSLVDYGASIGGAVDVMLPGDELNRAYKVRLSANDYRAQIVFIASERHSAHSLALQFNLFTNGPFGRRFSMAHEFAGQSLDFPVVLEDINVGAIAQEAQKNLRVNVADFVLHATVPVFQAPGDGEPNDGKAAPAGYPVVTEVNAVNLRTGVVIDDSVDASGVVTEVRSYTQPTLRVPVIGDDDEVQS
jgi:hypothetical protein